ncbi:MAG: pyridoxal 5'-phosphate synthase glutaminase subunit PdxT [bacterium]|nr:pyridoxal 5'-phosphate synthase glutaminase subunit PdxT [bacterium]
MMSLPVGLLALQGDFEMHRQALADLGHETRFVRRPAELAEVSALVIPGGESTTLTRLVARAGLADPLRAFASERPVLGTCAGLIMLSSELAGEKQGDFGVEPLGILDCVVSRNAYGRQIDSFTAPVDATALDGDSAPVRAVFIRAPRIMAVGAGAQVVVTHEGEPVGVRQGAVLGLTFHPELTSDRRLHRAFLELGG